MQITIQSPHRKVSDKTEEAISKKFERFEKLLTTIIRCDVILKKEKNSKQENFVVEARLVIPGNDLFSRGHAERFETAIDKVCADLESQIRKHKEKFNRKATQSIDSIIASDAEEFE